MTAGHDRTDQAAGTGPAPAAETEPTAAPSPGSDGEHPARQVGRAAGRAATEAARSTRRVIRRHPKADRAYRVTVGAVGGTTVALGVVLIPTPGPGALVTLGGLGILATEFEGARKVSRRANAAARQAYEAARESRRRKAEGAS